MTVATCEGEATGEGETWRLRARTSPRAIGEWREILAQTHVDFDVRATPRTPPTFYGAVTRRRCGEIAIVDCASAPFRARSGDGPGADVFGLQFVRRGVERVRERSRTLNVAAGDVLLWDGAEPTDIEVLEPFIKRTMIIPRERLLAVCPPLADVEQLPLIESSGPARLLSRYLDALALELPELDEPARTVAVDAALELLRAAIVPSLPSSRAARRAALRAEVRRHVRANLADPRLGPETIAAAHAMSVRALHALFEPTGESVSTMVRHERLARAHEDLGRASGGSVTEIAFRWGFHDAAHFARVFKQRFGATPSEVRRGAGV
jgi:AraC family transcriptional activator of tynA and feaB